MSKCYWRLGMLLLLLYCFNSGYAQRKTSDSSYIRQFAKQNVVELYPGIYHTKFVFTNLSDKKNNFTLSANSSAYTGIYVNYKWLSFKYAWAMPGTQLSRDTKVKYNSLTFRFSGRQTIFRPFFNSYNGLLIPHHNRSSRFESFRGIQITNTGADIYYYFSPDKFSMNAANYFSEQQVKSAGAMFLMVTPLWQRIEWKTPSRELISDSTTYDLLLSNPHWVSVTARLGYTYNFVIPNSRWSIAPAILLGTGALKETNSTRNKLQGVTDIQASLNAGYNGSDYYFYYSAWWERLSTNLLLKDLNQLNTEHTITFGYRFKHSRKKILGIL